MSLPIAVWASTGIIASPDPTKIAQGWLLAEKPPFEYMNWWMNSMALKINDLILGGPSSWDATNTYAVHAISRRNGQLYQALTANINKDPLTSPSDWAMMTANASYLSTGILPSGRIVGAYTGFTNINASGTITGGSFVGSGTGLTALSASALTSGFVPNARLAGTYNSGISAITVSGTVTAGAFVGSGAGLTNIDAADITAGILSSARIVGAYGGFTNITASGTITTTGGNVHAVGFYGNGINLTNLNASAIDRGIIPSERLAARYDNFTAVVASGNIQTTGGAFFGSGAGLSNLNATNLTVGTVNPDRLPDETVSAMRTLISQIIAAFGASALSNVVMARDAVDRDTAWGGIRDGADLIRCAGGAGDDGPRLPAGVNYRCMGHSAAGAGRRTIWQRVP